VDSGVEAGSQISLYYDSLLAKAIAHGNDRDAALARLSAGLSEMSILGVPTTQAFLRDAIAQPLFRDGRATTRFIETVYPENWQPDAAELMTLRAAACVSWAAPRVGDAGSEWVSPWAQRSAVRVTSAARPARLLMYLTDEYGEIDAEVHVTRDGIAVEIGGEMIAFSRPAIASQIKLAASDAGGAFRIHHRGNVVQIARNGLAIVATVQPKIDMSLSHGHVERSGNEIVAPLHGVVSKLYVAAGEAVAKGAPVLQMEAMKLIHTLTAAADGRIGAIRCNVGDTVPADAVLVEIVPNETGEKV
jgi:3-methylcrotonyl-CoA carboxylase alpha subunit